MKLIGILLLVLSNLAYSCEKEIPIEVKWKYDKKPISTDAGDLIILAPSNYEGWSLGGVHFYKGENTIPIMKYVSEDKFPGQALFQVTVTSDFLQGARFEAFYTPDPVKQEDGSFVVRPCLHTQDIEVKI